MTMVIEHITIRNLGTLQYYDRSFAPELNWVQSCYTSEIAMAVGYILCSAAIPEHWVGEETGISARVRLEGIVYSVFASPCSGRLHLSAVDPMGADATAQYRYVLTRCREQDVIESFDGQDETLPLRLRDYYYRDEEDDLSAKTQRITDTETFGRYLCHYIRTFQPEPINSKKPYQITLSSQGAFLPWHPRSSGKVHLSETEEKLFRYNCFLHIAEFWEGFEKIRDLHYEKKPLLVRNFAEFLDESVNLDDLMARTRKLQRQVLILTTATK